MHNHAYYDRKLRELSLWKWVKNNSIVCYDRKKYKLPQKHLEIVMNIFRDFSRTEYFPEGHDIIVIAVIMMIVTKFWEDVYYFTASNIAEMIDISFSDVVTIEYEVLSCIRTELLMNV